MRHSEALVLVAHLEAGVPHAKIPDETRLLYASKLVRYQRDAAEQAIAAVQEQWTDWRLPPWPIVRDAIVEEYRRRPALEAPEPELVLPDQEQRAAIRLVQSACEQRSRELQEGVRLYDRTG